MAEQKGKSNHPGEGLETRLKARAFYNDYP
jgi:hypothetical protein